ncbi:MAG: hypothetical protein QOF26_1985 [Baekduia sp.]|jgi:hypothetical protein|nr:hypothetical protein [Baekduia sp.]MDX6701759.1 hypothetical protein [Baekduia sp.]
MGVEDYMESPVAMAVAATAVVLSPRVRGVLRKGAVYGVAGAMKAADAVGSAARDVAGEARDTAGDDGQPATVARRGGQRTRAAST